MLPYKAEHGSAPRLMGAEEDNTRVVLRWINGDIGDPFIHRKQASAFGLHCRHHNIVVCPRQTLLHHGKCVMTVLSQIVHQIDRQMLIKFEFHGRESGIKVSSWASSAAYDRAASMCSVLNEG